MKDSTPRTDCSELELEVEDHQADKLASMHSILRGDKKFLSVLHQNSLLQTPKLRTELSVHCQLSDGSSSSFVDQPIDENLVSSSDKDLETVFKFPATKKESILLKLQQDTKRPVSFDSDKSLLNSSNNETLKNDPAYFKEMQFAGLKF